MDKHGWTYKRLTDICQIQYGYAFDSKCFCDDEQYPQLVRIRDVIRGYSETHYNGIIPEGYDVYKGDYLIGMDGEFNIAQWQSEKALLNQRVCKLSPTNSVKDRFIYYNLRVILKQIEDETPFVTVKHLSAKRLNTISIPVPPLAEQERIVAELDLLSGVIEKKKAQLNEYDQLAQSIFYDMFGDPVTNEKGWEPSTIGDCCILKSGNSDANNSSLGTLPYVKVGDMNMHGNETYINTSSTFVDREENKKNIFPVGTTIFPKRGGAILTNKKRITNIEICCDLNVMGVIPNQERLHPLYIYFYFLNIDFVIFGGTGSTIPQINNHNIAPMKIAIPPLSLQEEFAEKIEAIERQKALVQQSIEETQTMFDYTMDKYFG